MASTVTYIPGCHCCVCIQLGKHVASRNTVISEGRPYQACDLHAQLITLRGFHAAIKHVKRNTTKGAL